MMDQVQLEAFIVEAEAELKAKAVALPEMADGDRVFYAEKLADAIQATLNSEVLKAWRAERQEESLARTQQSIAGLRNALKPQSGTTAADTKPVESDKKLTATERVAAAKGVSVEQLIGKPGTQ